MSWIRTRGLALREVKNWFFIRKVCKRNKSNEDWIKFNLRSGYVSQIYTVVSLRKEDMGEEETMQRMRVIQHIEPINKYLEGLDLSEIVYPEIVFIPQSRSWLVIYWPIWENWSFQRLFLQIAGITAGYWIAKLTGMFEAIAGLF
jgi:hypothetical protein